MNTGNGVLRLTARLIAQARTHEKTNARMLIAPGDLPLNKNSVPPEARPLGLAGARPSRSSITLLSRIIDLFRECRVAIGTASGRSQKPRPDRFQDLLQRQTRSFFLPQGR